MAIQATPAVRYVPSATKVPTGENYLSIDAMDYTTHQLPDLDKTLNKRYDSQMIDGWFKRTGRRIPYASDVISWTEEDRLTQLALGVARTADVFTFVDHTFRAGEILTAFLPDGTVLRKGRIMSTTSTTFTVLCGDAAGWSALGSIGITCFADMSEFSKGTLGMQESLNTKYEQFTTRGTITKEMVKDNRTNMTQISWLKASDGSGYLWYDVNKENTEKRFKNKIESAHYNSDVWTGDLAAAGYKGREGMFTSIGQGNRFSGFIGDRDAVENMVDRLQKQGGLENNLIYGTTAFCFAQDRFLASTNSMLQGVNYGAFDNSAEMSMDLSFQGYRIGGFEFSYSRSKYLDNPIAQGAIEGINKVNGFLVPAASQSVKDNISGKQVVRPMIHVRNRQYGALNREYEVVVRDWAQGTSLEDRITTEFQSEEALCVLARNNYILFKG